MSEVSFFAAGGWPMYPLSFFGFLLIAASVRFALHPARRLDPLLFLLGTATLLTGLFGTALGISLSARYLEKVEVQRQVAIFAMGLNESLNNAILASLLVVAASLIAAWGVVRAQREGLGPA